MAAGGEGLGPNLHPHNRLKGGGGTRRTEAATEKQPPALVSKQTYLGRLQEVTWGILKNNSGMEYQNPKQHLIFFRAPLFLPAPYTISLNRHKARAPTPCCLPSTQCACLLASRLIPGQRRP